MIHALQSAACATPTRRQLRGALQANAGALRSGQRRTADFRAEPSDAFFEGQSEIAALRASFAKIDPVIWVGAASVVLSTPGVQPPRPDSWVKLISLKG